MVSRTMIGRAFCLATTLCCASVICSAQTPLDLLQRVAQNYQQLRSFNFTGHLTTTIPDTRISMVSGTANAAVNSEFVPAGSAGNKLGEAFSFRGGGLFTDTNGQPTKLSDYGFISVSMPTHLGGYDQINVGVRQAQELSPESLTVDGNSLKCVVLQVLYDRQGWQPAERTVRYWIDATRLLVLQQQQSSLQDPDDTSIVWRWTYTVDSVKLNEPPPQWLIQSRSSSRGDHPSTDWAGKEAPSFDLPDLDGHHFDLSAMRGKAVLLDFWATWCGPCIEEIPIVESLRSEYSSQDLEILGISDERPNRVREWMTAKGHKLPTAIDRLRVTFNKYGVEGIPSIVVVDRQGKVASYYLGNQSRDSLRTAIDLALSK